MDESEKTDSRLEVSVSFGRFENDKLSWEKWSSFSTNKNLEEVGSLSTPGSVAQKKAYFEAHYKKIAARKAEELEQDGQVAPVALSKDVPSIKHNLENSSGIEAKHEFCNGEKSYDETAMDANRTALRDRTVADEAQDKVLISIAVVNQEGSPNGLVNVTPLDEEKGEALIAVENRNSMAQEGMEELNVGMVDKKLNVTEKASPIEEETPPTASQEGAEYASERKHVAELSSALKKKNSKPNSRNVPQKVIPKKEINFSSSNKKAVSPVVKPLQASTPTYSKSEVPSTPITTSVIGKKKVIKSQLPNSKQGTVVENKRATPTSLHMSLSLQRTNSSSAFSLTRKSLIMEKMGDKDFVKRAFKSFQTQMNVNELDKKSSSIHQVPSTSFETKMFPSLTPRKENTGLGKAVEMTASQRGQLTPKSKPLRSGSRRIHGMNKKNVTAVSPTICLRTDEKSEKRKQFLRNLEAKSIAREAENVQLNERPKEEKGLEIGKMGQTLNFKASPLPSFSQGQRQGRLEKERSSSKTTQHRTASSNMSSRQ